MPETLLANHLEHTPEVLRLSQRTLIQGQARHENAGRFSASADAGELDADQDISWADAGRRYVRDDDTPILN